MDRESWYVLVGSVLLVVALAASFVGGAEFGMAVVRKNAITYGYADYNVVTGKWQWKIDLRPALHDSRSYLICGTCGGSGEINLDEYLGEDPRVPSQNMVKEF